MAERSILDLITEQGRANRVNVSGPFGSSNFTRDPEGQYTLNLAPNAQQQRAFNDLSNMSHQPTNRLWPNLGGVYTTSPLKAAQFQSTGMRPQPINVQGPSDPRRFGASANQRQIFNASPAQGIDQTRQAVFDQAMSLFQPQFDLSQRRLDQKLANQGLPMGSEGFTEEQNRLQDQQGRAVTNAALSAVLAGNDEAARQYANQLAGFNANVGASASDFGQRLGAAQNLFGQGMDIANFGLNRDLSTAAQNFGQGLQASLFDQGLLESGFDRNLQGQAFNAGEDQRRFGNQLGLGQARFGQELSSNQDFRSGEAQRAALAQALLSMMPQSPIMPIDVLGSFQGELASKPGNRFRDQLFNTAGNLGAAAIYAEM